MSALLDWKHLTFAHPAFFGLLLLLPVMIWWQLWGRKKENPALRLTTLSGMAMANPGFRARFRGVLFMLRIITLLALTVALARPRTSNTTENIDSEGIDIVLAIDLSGSMLAEDFKPNRIEAAKSVAMKFVDERPGDRIGLVVFGGESFSMCPITIDHNVLKEQIAALKIGLIDQRTGIGLGLASAVNRLRFANGKSKVVILMTDGVNNVSTPISPLSALEIAKAFKVRVYTIGVGSNAGQALTPVPMAGGGIQKVMMPIEIDEALLRQVSAETGGRYFRATGNRSLEGVYNDIDKLEKTRIEITSYKHYAELFFPFAMVAAIALFLEMLLRYTVFRTIT